MPRSSAIAAMATLLALVAQPRPGSAQVDATAAARALFTEGVEAANAEDWPTAEDRFARALALRWAPPIAYNLAQAQLRNGHFVAAAENFRALLRSDETAPSLREAAGPLLADAEAQLGRLVVHVRGDRQGVVIRVGDQEIPEAMWDVAIPVDPGLQRVVGLRGDEEVARATVEIVPQARQEVSLEIPEAGLSAEEAARAALAQDRGQLARADAGTAEAGSPPNADEGRRRRRRVIAFTVVGVLVAAAAGTALALTLGGGPGPTNGNTTPGAIDGSVF